MIGIYELLVYIQGFDYLSKLYVMPQRTTNTSMILENVWKRKYNCKSRWHKEAAKLMMNKKNLLIPFLSEQNCHFKSNEESNDKEPLPTIPYPKNSQVPATSFLQNQASTSKTQGIRQTLVHTSG